VKKRDDEPTAAHTLYNLIDRRHGRASTAVSSNIALSEWGNYLGDATLIAAILDRLAMHAVRLHIDGPSYRQHFAEDRAAKRRRSRDQAQGKRRRRAALVRLPTARCGKSLGRSGAGGR
jgi:DNA replication protein DnaC